MIIFGSVEVEVRLDTFGSIEEVVRGIDVEFEKNPNKFDIDITFADGGTFF